MNKLIPTLCILLALLSCSKSDSPTATPPLTMLQNKWLLDSVIVYPATGLSSDNIYAYKSPDAKYIDFKIDNKVYSYGGNPVVTYDTTTYHLQTDNTTFFINLIKNGVESAKSDTAYILTLTSNSFVYYTRNAARQYNKAVLKR